MRYTCASAGILVVLSAIAPLTAFAQVQGLSVTNYQLVSEQRISRNESYLTYRADLVNTGPARSAITATVFSAVPAVQTVPGQTNLHFAPVPANSQVTSNNTFTILVDRTIDFNFSSLQWSFVAPVANAGPNQTVSVGSTVTLNGSASSNPSGIGNLDYNWTFVARPVGSSVLLFAANSVSPTFVASTAGDYVLRLTVSNGGQRHRHSHDQHDKLGAGRKRRTEPERCNRCYRHPERERFFRCRWRSPHLFLDAHFASHRERGRASARHERDAHLRRG